MLLFEENNGQDEQFCHNMVKLTLKGVEEEILILIGEKVLM